eukprot:m.31954 g.31954  ORF g.31954 m.31954 type:complete len:89 (+) comp14070_c0_seq2:992-1258(+)
MATFWSKLRGPIKYLACIRPYFHSAQLTSKRGGFCCEMQIRHESEQCTPENGSFAQASVFHDSTWLDISSPKIARHAIKHSPAAVTGP